MENNKYEKFLPLGTVVILKDGEKKLMITGYCLKAGIHRDKIYDYASCLYPEGIITTANAILFNHTDIDKVISLGYIDNNYQQLNNSLKIYQSDINVL